MLKKSSQKEPGFEKMIENNDSWLWHLNWLYEMD